MMPAAPPPDALPPAACTTCPVTQMSTAKKRTSGQAGRDAAVAAAQLAVPAQLLPLQRHPLILAIIVEQQSTAAAGVPAHHLSRVPLAVAVKEQGHLSRGGMGEGLSGQQRVAKGALDAGVGTCCCQSATAAAQPANPT